MSRFCLRFSMSMMKLGCQGLCADKVNQAELRNEVKRFNMRRGLI